MGVFPSTAFRTSFFNILLGACVLSGSESSAVNAKDLEAIYEKGRTVQVTAKKNTACCEMARTTAIQRALGRAVAGFVGTSRIKTNGRRFSYDCSGLARGTYFSQGIDLYQGVSSNGRTSGVRLIKQYVEHHGRLHHGPSVQPGDFVFFHNTWDANKDRRLNDLWTHIGIVERVEPNGTVVFVSRVSRGVERYRMNLHFPVVHREAKGPVLNDFLRRKRWRDSSGTPYLSGQLFAAFGTLTH